MKILEIKGKDWMTGFSRQAGIATTGLFQSMYNFDPFENEGYLQPALAVTDLTAPATNPIKVITPIIDGTTPKFYAHSETKIYEYLRNTPYTQTDLTAQLDFTAATGVACAGAISWKGYYIYAQAGDLRSRAIPISGGSDVQILNGGDSSYQDIRPMCIGSDKNLYIGGWGNGAGGGLAKITSATGTAGNTLDFFGVDDGFTVRDIVNDGRYLVLIADNNHITTTSRVVGDYQCKVYFWDPVRALTTADVIYDIQDSYLIGAEIVDGKVHIFGYNGIYVCNSANAPQLIWSFLGNSTVTKRPISPYAITVGNGIIYWGDGGTNGQQVYALRGNVVYSPYQTHQGTTYHTALQFSANALLAGTTLPKMSINNIGSTRSNVTVLTTIFQLSQPHKLDFIKVTLKAPMSSGMEVDLSMFDSNGSLLKDSDSKTFAVVGAKKTLIFKPVGSSNTIKEFEDFYLTINPIGGAVIERVAVYATPSDDNSQMI